MSITEKDTVCIVVTRRTRRIMTNSYSSIVLLVSTLFCFSSFSYEFKHFSIKGDLAAKNLRTSKSSQLKNIAPDSQSPLIERINEIVGHNYNQIGENESRPLILNHDIGGGVLNFSGFSWRKPAGNIKLYANREITPDMFSNKFIVHDTLTVSIDASSYLSQLKEDGVVEISQADIGAFVGVGFKRVYHYYHFAETYSQGVGADYSKLFLSFSKFNVDHVINMDPYQILKKEDSFYFNAGGKFTSPGSGISASAGVLVDVAFQNEVILQSLGQSDVKKEDEILRVSREKSWNITATAAVSVQLDFFNLLKLTLLEGELEYSYGQTNKQNLSFFERDISLMMNSEAHHGEFKKIIKGQTDTINSWKQNIISLEDRVKENFNSRYSVLLFGKIRKKQTQQVRIIKDGVESLFYTHYSQSTKYIQNLLSRLINIVVVRIFDFDTGVANYAESSQKMKLEYESKSDLEKETVNTDEEFSLRFTQKYQANKTHRWFDRKLKRNAVQRIKAWSNLNREVASLVSDEKLKGPLNFESQIEVEKTGLTYFHGLSTEHIVTAIVRTCNSRRLKDWLNSRKRSKMLRRPQIGRNACVKTLTARYFDYKEHVEETGQRNLTKLRRFVGKYFSKTDHLIDLYNIFGEQNVFVHGTMTAQTNTGAPFSTFFKTGQFRGLGVIDNFTREIGTTVPVQ